MFPCIYLTLAVIRFHLIFAILPDFYALYHLHHYFWICIAYSPWPCISTFLYIISFTLLFLNLYYVFILALYIYFDIIKIFSSLYLFSNKSLQIENFYLDITMFFLLYTIHGYPELSILSLLIAIESTPIICYSNW